MKLLLFLLSALLAMPAAPPPSRSAVTLQIKNDVPKFLRFYRDASRFNVNEAQRWALWQKEYGMAAVPPTPEGMALARKQLDAVWPRYRSLVPKLPALTLRAITDAQTVAKRIGRELDTQGRPVTIKLVVYVGQFDGNAFSIPSMKGDPPTTLMPVETPNIQLLLAHELSHAVHFALVGVKNSFGAPLDETIFLEGLAMHSASHVIPGYPDTAYTEMPGDRGWLQRCFRQKDAVLRGVRSYLEQSGPAVGSRFTFGIGTTGMHREAYCAGWIIVGTLLAHGDTLSNLAGVPEDRMISVVRDGLQESLR